MPRVKRLEVSGPLNLALTLTSGQVFHAVREGARWHVLVGREPLELEQRGSELWLHRGRPRIARHFLSLDHDLEKLYEAFPGDRYSREALAACHGLRIVRQPPWECLATFLASPLKKVEHIRQISFSMRARYGQPVAGSPVQAFPDPERLAELDEASLRACGLGFRAKNVLEAARRVASGAMDWEALRRLPTSRLRETLMELPGVGRKVANCVMLFAFERLDVVPVDTWVARIVERLRGRAGRPLTLERSALRRFGRWAGYVQQYLFHHARTTGKLPEP